MKHLLSGNEAAARGAYEAGVKVCSAYPGTPSTEIFENLPQYKDSLYCEWAPNEKVATEVAIGAALGTGCPALVITGDGSFQMAMNELAAIRAADMDIKIVLFRNHTLGLVHQIQSSAPYHGPFGVALDGSPDFETIAAAYRVPCIQVGDEDHLDEALDRFLGTQGSCLLICEVHPDVGTND